MAILTGNQDIDIDEQLSIVHDEFMAIADLTGFNLEWRIRAYFV